MTIEMKTLYPRLAERIGEEALGARLRMQVDHAASLYSSQGQSHFHLENSEWMPILLRFLLRRLGIYENGRRNTLKYQHTLNQVRLPSLPATMHGFRMLHLSDIHGDAIIDSGASLKDAIAQCRFDCCVITGDFRFLTLETYAPAMDFMCGLAPLLVCEAGVFAVLGNHDFIEQVPYLEAMGVRVLLNECLQLDATAPLWLAGVDDPHFYGSHDIVKAMSDCPADSCVVLLSHSPEIYVEAASAGVALMLSGHTHGGQICLPGGRPIITNANCPTSFCAGAWRHGDMQGYTSRGCGASGETVRFYCAPEIVVHELLCA